MKDHFGNGNNVRVWNALEKHAMKDPQSYIDYYSNDVIATVSRAWLGPWYQTTAQVNLVMPGCKAQLAHCDYHLGYFGDELGERFPVGAHMSSQFITLQGAVAHGDMPVESGPTLLLPHSQKYDWGYLAWRQDKFREYFDANRRQLPLKKGDMLFFNPALFHAAGENTSQDIRRMANLLQISSCMGRPMEGVDRARVSSKIFTTLKDFYSKNGRRLTENTIASSAEGYPFPTNLDRDAGNGGLAPQTQAELFTQAIVENWEQE